jgi:hypothetical protein
MSWKQGLVWCWCQSAESMVRGASSAAGAEIVLPLQKLLFLAHQT